MASKKKKPLPGRSRGATTRPPDELSGGRAEERLRENLDQSVVAQPLLATIHRDGPKARIRIIIDLNLTYPRGKGLQSAKARAIRLAKEAIAAVDTGVPGCCVDVDKSNYAFQHVFARMTGNQIHLLLEKCGIRSEGLAQSPIYKVWPDNEVRGQLDKSVCTIKSDAALISYTASGDGQCWAVIDSGIDGAHPHFREHKNLLIEPPLHHVDFTGETVREIPAAEMPTDENGHGTHVAGIIAGERKEPVTVVTRRRDEAGDVYYSTRELPCIRGVAPKCKLVSLKVLGERGRGLESNLIAALGYISTLNSQGRWPLIHGVNMSVGYEFDAEWFACGHSPLCVEVNRLVRSGVVVVVASGNTGYGFAQTQSAGAFKSGLDVTINDPGNAELAITVGSTHREHPHTYGVSYFSSKGPTGDGRLKPDLVAPGERVVSCAAGPKKAEILGKPGVTDFEYREESGTSMAAPHVAGAIAAFLSIRREFIGEPERIKRIFLSTCTDLGRDRTFQGHGLLDLMRAIQSV